MKSCVWNNLVNIPWRGLEWRLESDRIDWMRIGANVNRKWVGKFALGPKCAKFTDLGALNYQTNSKIGIYAKKKERKRAFPSKIATHKGVPWMADLFLLISFRQMEIRSTSSNVVIPICTVHSPSCLIHLSLNPVTFKALFKASLRDPHKLLIQTQSFIKFLPCSKFHQIFTLSLKGVLKILGIWLYYAMAQEGQLYYRSHVNLTPSPNLYIFPA